MTDLATKLQYGKHHDPFELLGLHELSDGYVIREFMPVAETVELDELGLMQRVTGTDIFEIELTSEQLDSLPDHYRLNWVEKDTLESHTVV